MRLAILFDYPEEGWPSMDLCASMLLDALQRRGPQPEVGRVAPRFVRRLMRLPFAGRSRLAWNADRLLNRMRDYPRHLRTVASSYDLFHVADHSYAQLVHDLPAERTGVYCHDLETFRCLLDPSTESRPRWFRAMARRVLEGFQSAAVVFHSTREMRRQIEEHALVPSSRLVYAPLGVDPVFGPEPTPGESMPKGLEGAQYLLHVGSCIPRKRIDVLLDCLAEVRRDYPELRLVQVGGQWTAEQLAQIDRLGIGSALTQLRGIDQSLLASLYRRAALVLLPSEAEGFGLPLLEALACGSTVVSSDLTTLREVGGGAAVFCPVGDVPSWATTVVALLRGGTSAPERSVRVAQARRFSWSAHAETIAQAYLRLTARRGMEAGSIT